MEMFQNLSLKAAILPTSGILHEGYSTCIHFGISFLLLWQDRQKENDLHRLTVSEVQSMVNQLPGWEQHGRKGARPPQPGSRGKKESEQEKRGEDENTRTRSQLE